VFCAEANVLSPGGAYCSNEQPTESARSDVLIDEDRIAIRVHRNKAGRSGCTLVRLFLESYPFCLELTLQLTDVSERIESLGVAIPSGVEGKNILLEHALKEAYDVVAFFRISHPCEASPANTAKPNFS
jgi:hypothetical protein